MKFPAEETISLSGAKVEAETIRVVSDWNMPNCTGLDFPKRVRADSNLKETPFVLLTAESEIAQVKGLYFF